MGVINSTTPHYIRCIKPNSQRKPAGENFDTLMSFRQLTYAGVFEAVSIRRQGYPFRLSHEKFFKKYRCLAPTLKGSDYANLCKHLLSTIQSQFAGQSHLLDQLAHVQMGTTMVLYKSEQQTVLDALRNAAVRQLVVHLQARMYLQFEEIYFFSKIGWKRFEALNLYKAQCKVREDARKAIQTKDEAHLKRIVEESVELPFEFREIKEAKRLYEFVLEERRLNEIFNTLNAQLKGDTKFCENGELIM